LCFYKPTTTKNLKLPRVLISYEPTFNLVSNTLTNHYYLIWGIGTISGVAVGWSSYYARKYHHHKLENKMDSVTQQISDMEREMILTKYYYRWTVPNIAEYIHIIVCCIYWSVAIVIVFVVLFYFVLFLLNKTYIDLFDFSFPMMIVD
jgi:hypothetical protein